MTFRSHWFPAAILSVICFCGFTLSVVVGQEAMPEPGDPAAMGAEAGAGDVVPEGAAAQKKTATDTDVKNDDGEGTEEKAKSEEGESELETTKVTVGEYTIHNSNPGKGSERKKTRHPQLWKFYMHGVSDFFATPLQWTDLFGEAQEAQKWLDEKAVVKTPFKVSPLPSIRLTKGQSLFLEKPLIDGDTLEELRGSMVRVFVWIAGKDTGQGTDLWGGAPGVDIIRIGLDGKPLQVCEAPMKTRGTFLWHCYYQDVWVPSDFSRPSLTEPEVPAVEEKKAADTEEKGKEGEAKEEGDEGKGEQEAEKKEAEKADDDNAGKTDKEPAEKEATVAKADDGPYRSKGLYVRLFNPASGTAWFSTVSWEKVSEENTYDQNEKQDPVTGSLAPNPYFDELPMHLCWGKGTQFPWNFLAGRRGGAFGVPDITTIAGLSAYYSKMAKRDFHHLSLGVSQLADWVNFGRKLALLPPMEDGWLEALTKIILDEQDEATGLWGYGEGNLSVALTTAYVEGLFGQKRIVREGREATVMPWRGLPVEEIPNAMKLVDTVIGMQSMYGKNGRDRGGWSLFAYEYKEQGELEPSITCSLASTANAMYLLRLCEPVVGRSYQNRIRESVTAATDFAFAHCVTPNGLWRQSEVDEGVTTAAHMPRIVEASYLLEGHPVITLKPPMLDVAPVRKGTFVFVWGEPDSAAVSLRIYAVPRGTPSEDVATGNLVGIVHRTGETLKERDPLLVVKTMRDAAKQFWHLAWDGDLYAFTNSELSMLPANLTISMNAEPLTVKLKGSDGIDIYACTVNARGECSRLVGQAFDIAEPGDPEEETSAGADGGDNADVGEKKEEEQQPAGAEDEKRTEETKEAEKPEAAEEAPAW